MARYFEAMRAAIERHGGSVEKFIGDAVMAVFGVPQVHEDDALRAVRAAAEMREALEELNAELARTWGFTIETRTGINTGEVFVGDRTRGQDPILGDPVNIAARLEQAAEPGQILLGETTYHLVRDAVSATTVGPLAVKGKPEPLVAWQLHEVVPGASGWARNLARGPRRPRARAPPARGRLRARRGRAVVRDRHRVRPGRRGQVAPRPRAHRPARRRGDRRRGALPPVRRGHHVLADRVGPHGRRRDRRARPARAVAAQDLRAPRRRRRLRARRRAARAAPRRRPRAGRRSRRPSGAVRKLFEHLGSQRPLVAVFDDIQWGEPTFLDLLEYLADWLRGAPVLLLCLARPELLDVRPEWVTPKANAELVTLTPLTAHETDGLIQGLLEGDELEPEARVRITEMAEGNPLFVEQTLRMLVDDGALERRDGRWTATQDLSRITIPPTISALLTARLARLDAGERAVIERASIVGRVFWWAAVAEISGGEVRPHVISHLQSLTRKELIRPDYSENGREASFRFGHILIRDAAYHGIPKGERAELHERLADWLEVEARDMAGEFEEILGYHVEQARRLLLEVAPLGRARRGARPARRLDPGRRRPAGVRPRRHAGRREPALARGRGHARADPRARRAPRPARVRPARHRRPRAPRGRGRRDDPHRGRQPHPRARAVRGDHRRSGSILSWNPEGWAEAADRRRRRRSPRSRPPATSAGWRRPGRSSASLHIERAEFRSAEDAWTRAAAHAHRCGDRRDELESLSWVPLAVWAGPTPVDEGLRRCADVLARADGDKKLMASALVAQAVLEADTGRVDDARRDIARAKALLEEVALALWLAGPGRPVRGLGRAPRRRPRARRGASSAPATSGSPRSASCRGCRRSPGCSRRRSTARAATTRPSASPPRARSPAGAEDAYSHALVAERAREDPGAGAGTPTARCATAAGPSRSPTRPTSSTCGSTPASPRRRRCGPRAPTRARASRRRSRWPRRRGASPRRAARGRCSRPREAAERRATR